MLSLELTAMAVVCAVQELRGDGEGITWPQIDKDSFCYQTFSRPAVCASQTRGGLRAEIEATQLRVCVSHELARCFEAKIKNTITRVWSAA
jgi:hypothetical protein